MTYYDQQQSPLHNAQFNPMQWAQFNPQAAYGQQAYGQPWAGFGLGQAAYGQPQWWNQQQPQWWGQQQRQLSQHDVNEVVRQLVPALPHILAQAQQPQGAFGYAAYGQGPYWQGPRLSPQDVNEVVRQILPIVPQIVGALQGQPQLQHAAFHGGIGLGQIGQQNPLAGWMQQQPFGQYGVPQFQAAHGGGPIGWGHQQRQLTQQDVAEVTRQLVGLIPQVIGNLQAINQQRMI
jgi:hypothetical protein